MFHLRKMVYGLLCSVCERWFHTKCQGILESEYGWLFANPTEPWTCLFCCLPQLSDSFFDRSTLSDSHCDESDRVPDDSHDPIFGRDREMLLKSALMQGVWETKWWTWFLISSVPPLTLCAFQKPGWTAHVMQMSHACHPIKCLFVATGTTCVSVVTVDATRRTMVEVAF